MFYRLLKLYSVYLNKITILIAVVISMIYVIVSVYEVLCHQSHLNFLQAQMPSDSGIMIIEYVPFPLLSITFIMMSVITQ